MAQEQMHLVTNTGDTPVVCSFSGKVYIWNPNPKFASATFGMVESKELYEVVLLSGRKIQVPAQPQLAKLSDKPGPFRHYVPASMLPILFTGTRMLKGKSKVHEYSGNLVVDDMAVEQAEATLHAVESAVSSKQALLADMQAKIAAMEAKVNGAEVDKILREDGVKLPTNRVLK